VAVVSADNMGKDPTRGSRGSSVKTDKADCVVPLRRTDQGINLTPSHARGGGYLTNLDLQAEGFYRSRPIRYWRIAYSWPAGTREAVDILERLGIPPDWGRRKIRALLRDQRQYRIANDTLTAAIRWRKQPPELRATPGAT
jgi:hypothetical protein